jgi:hypothetical protein
MTISEIPDPVFREAVDAIDAGDVGRLDRLLSENPRLVRDRLDYGEGYFERPYLLWFVAENPVRNERLPAIIAQVTAVILDAAKREAAASLREQADGALGLVCSGRVPRECGVQRELIDVLGDAGANLDGALVPALAHREVDAAEHLLKLGAKLTLLAAVCTDRSAEVARLARAAGPNERQAALAGAALYGHAASLALLIDLGADVDAFSPPGSIRTARRCTTPSTRARSTPSRCWWRQAPGSTSRIASTQERRFSGPNT